MGKVPTPLTEKGADHARDLYELVGVALSWWEASEDIILGLYKHLCGDVEPVGLAAFIQAPRSVRYSMLKLAMQTYSFLITEDEIKTVERSLKQLDKIASTRNEIAHGHVSNFSLTVDGQQSASGNYLLPSLNEGAFHERGFRFHHTPSTLMNFIDQVRKCRGEILSIDLTVNQRVFERSRFGVNDMIFFQLARKISRLEVPGRDAFELMRHLVNSTSSQLE